FYAAGSDLHLLSRLARDLKEGQLLDLTVPRWGLIRGDRLEALVRTLTRGLTFAALKVPLYVVAVDIEKGELVVLDKGRVADAVRASIAVPGIFVPKRLEGRLLVDGAVLAPVPVGVLRERGATTVVAVDVHYSIPERETGPVNNLFELFFRSLALTGRAMGCQALEQADVVIRPAVGHLSPARLHNVEEYIKIGRRAALE
ncbi:MAG: patatin-like phospholipase family protein, partial [Moorella sp. (in: Bacteria)]|nr:patatin-like phospholipase family protein [Moorella sp. (in: firmicutes)]